jgi:acetate kinase
MGAIEHIVHILIGLHLENGASLLQIDHGYAKGTDIGLSGKAFF